MFTLDRKEQLTLDFESGPAQRFSSCREYIQYLVHCQKKPQKIIAADMDISPSDLSRKLSQNDNDKRRFTLDDLEKFIEVTGDKQPIFYLIEKYLVDSKASEIQELEQRLAELKRAA